MTAQQKAATDNEGLSNIVILGKAVGDALRAGILQVLRHDSYSVGELCALFDVPQPALSHHLKILRQAGLVAQRREGNSIFYRRAALGSDAAAALLEELDQGAIPDPLAREIRRIHEARNRRSAEFFAQNAAQISTQQAQICEPSTYSDVVMEMLDRALAEGLDAGNALEVGPGPGTLLAALGERFDAVVGVDNSRAMLRAAEQAIGDRPGIRLRHQDFMTLPAQRRYDAVIAAMVVHHQASPAAFFQQAASVLHQRGVLLVAELCRHDQRWASDACGDQWLGFEPEELDNWAQRAGLEPIESQYLAQKNGFRIQVHQYRPAARSARQIH